MPLQASNQITPRYRHIAPLGAGSMGTVSRVYDRLTGQEVALKQVRLPDALDADAATEELRLLATEFRTLAGLRHPHIISVLDYGFDGQRQPFFTMELLHEAKDILTAGRHVSIMRRCELLLEALEALAYLHRRGVLHHDLKPENMLVTHGRVRLLDFGLAVLANQERNEDAFGTLQYLAPEVICGQSYSEQADLYSLGVIAYELLLGHHPIAATTVRAFLQELRTSPPDLSALADQPALAQVIGQLLDKTPRERPPTAQAAIAALRVAVGLSEQPGDTDIRESYLQAATFVGREHELTQLTSALEQARNGKGSAWLVGGESGVGKSRLLDELRTQALVSGFTVLRGQAVEGGGLPYQLWREPLRSLALTTELSDLEASVLKDLVPDIGGLLGRALAEVAPLTGEAGRQRLVLTIVTVLRRQTTPLLLLVEDLHWAGESLEPLHELHRWVTDLPLVVVGNYRDEERPTLPTELPGMQLLKLERLTEAAIAELSGSILGEHGREPGVLTLLARETEGNVFFLIEVVRELAEAAGSLEQIGRATLPSYVFAGGVQQVLRRRLARVPPAWWGLLKLAAVAGRQLDLAVLTSLAHGTELRDWLTGCAEAAVLEVFDNQWRFAHDKLREAVLADLGDDERPTLHRQVAEALERVYPGQSDLAEVLMGHWRTAGDPAHELHYLLQVAGHWISHGIDSQGACTLLERGLTLATGLPDAAQQQMHSYRWLGKAYEQLSDYTRADQAFTQCRKWAEQLGDVLGLAAAMRGMGRTAWRQGQLILAQERCEQALGLYRQANDLEGIADCLSDVGVMCVDQFHFNQGDAHLKQALALYYTLNNDDGIRVCLNDLGISASLQGNYSTQRDYFLKTLALARQINHRLGIGLALLNLGWTALTEDAFSTAQAYLSESLKIARELDDQLMVGLNLNNLGAMAVEQQDNPLAQSYLSQGLAIFREIKARLNEAMTLINFVLLAARQADYSAALAYCEQSLAIYTELDHPDIAWALTVRAWLHLEQQACAAAQADLHTALTLAYNRQLTVEQLQLLPGWAYLYLLTDRAAQAAELIGLAESRPEFAKLNRRRFLLPVLEQLAAILTPEQLAAARRRGATLVLEVVIDGLLHAADS